MNELLLDQMYRLMDVAHVQEQNGKIFPASLYSFREIFLRINQGCSCTKRNREQHAEATYRNIMLTLPPVDQHELKIFLGVGEKYDKAIIKDKSVFLLELNA